MQARAPLMAEHRLINKVVGLFKKKMEIMKKNKKADVDFIRGIIDFIRIYADKTHHGKEEDILFENLDKKSMEEKDREDMEELIQEHRWTRKKVKNLEKALEKYAGGEQKSINDIIENTEKLVEFYPRHIEKEDRGFFLVSRKYLSQQEENEMLKEFKDFDSRMIHEKYEAFQKKLAENI